MHIEVDMFGEESLHYYRNLKQNKLFKFDILKYSFLHFIYIFWECWICVSKLVAYV